MTHPTMIDTVRPCWSMLIMALVLGLLGLGAFGCGVKGPPLPPQPSALPAVVDLGYRVADQSVRLTWHLPKSLDGKPAVESVFGVYRSQTALADAPCDACPLVFQKVGRVPYVNPENTPFFFDADLSPGYRHVFKVRLESPKAVGVDSNRVAFDFFADGTVKAYPTP